LEVDVPRPIQALLDHFIEQFALAIAARAEKTFAQARMAGAARPCPFPRCKSFGAGPRNRWFCRHHARSVPVAEQKRILAARAEAERAARLAHGSKRDMRCRVEGCKNTSRGPRFGYICDKHRAVLSSKQQREARERWNAARAEAA
jgi:hypothetical protein